MTFDLLPGEGLSPHLTVEQGSAQIVPFMKFKGPQAPRSESTFSITGGRGLVPWHDGDHARQYSARYVVFAENVEYCSQCRRVDADARLFLSDDRVGRVFRRTGQRRDQRLRTLEERRDRDRDGRGYPPGQQ